MGKASAKDTAKAPAKSAAKSAPAEELKKPAAKADAKSTNKADNNSRRDYVGRLVYTLPVDYASWLRQFQLGASYYRGYTSITTGVDNALTGIGGQRATQLLQNVYDANPTVDHYLNRAAFGSPVNGTLSTMRPNNVQLNGSLQVDMNLSRTFQIVQPFAEFSALDNVAAAALFSQPGASLKSARTAMQSGAASCRQCPCPGACGPAATLPSTSRCSSATGWNAPRPSPRSARNPDAAAT